MAKKYHINPETGRPNQCTATVRDCKFAQGDLIPEHYDSKEGAQAAYEKKMEEQDKGLSTLKKNPKKTIKPGIKDNRLNAAKLPGAYKKTPYDYALESYENSDYKDEVSEKTYTDTYFNVSEMFNNSRVHSRINIDEYDSSIEFDEGEYYHPSPDEDYHESDISYTRNPSFIVKDKEAFVAQTLLESQTDRYEKLERISDVGIEKLDEAGYFNENNYEAKIGNYYYGDEFEGWTLDNDVKEKTIAVITDELISQKIDID